jgi:hypothetical protein
MSIGKVVAMLVGLLVLYVVFVPPVCACVNKTPGYVAQTKADLRNLVTAQEGFYVDSARYARSYAELDSAYLLTSPGTTVRIDAVSDSGFLASGAHAQVPELRCQLAFGSYANGALPDGEPVCTPSYQRPWYRRRAF